MTIRTDATLNAIDRAYYSEQVVRADQLMNGLRESVMVLTTMPGADSISADGVDELMNDMVSEAARLSGVADSIVAYSHSVWARARWLTRGHSVVGHVVTDAPEGEGL